MRISKLMGQCFSVHCSLYFVVLYIAIVRGDSFHCIEQVWCFIVLNGCKLTFSLKELTPQTVLRFGCVMFKNILKSI